MTAIHRPPIPVTMPTMVDPTLRPHAGMRRALGPAPPIDVSPGRLFRRHNEQAVAERGRHAGAHYGAHGDYRSCGQASDESAEAVARRLAAPHPWRGEVFGDNRAAIPDGEPLARLTYNPRFAELLDQIDEFLTEIATDRAGERP